MVICLTLQGENRVKQKIDEEMDNMRAQKSHLVNFINGKSDSLTEDWTNSVKRINFT